MIDKVIRKSMKIRFSGRSSDFISPSFGHGCLYKCSYCYMRRHKPASLSVATNIGEILTAINHHSYLELLNPTVSKPNQTDDAYVTYDISCNEDFALHAKFYNWEKIFEFFRDHEIAKATLATKYIPKKFLNFNPNSKVRIRFSLMPQSFSSILEPSTSLIVDRINAIKDFIDSGYEVHLNFSPVIWHSKISKTLYKKLFQLVDTTVPDQYKDQIKAEVIFMTHNEKMHEYNVNNGHNKAEKLLWCPSIQESKTSQYGGNNLRYKYKLKNQFIEEFKQLHNQIMPWNKIRYIF